MPQLRAALDACDRRDAALALQSLSVVHAAHAPLVAGREGLSIFDKCVASLKRIIHPASGSAESSVFRQLASRAQVRTPKPAP